MLKNLTNKDNSNVVNLLMEESELILLIHCFIWRYSGTLKATFTHQYYYR